MVSGFIKEEKRYVGLDQKLGNQGFNSLDNSGIDKFCVTHYIQVTRHNLVGVLTTKKTKTRNEQFIVPYRYEEVSFIIPASPWDKYN